MGKMRLGRGDEEFFAMFERAADLAAAATAELELMIEDLPGADVHRQRIGELEHEGDRVIHDVMERLNRTFMAPMDQEDIRAIAGRLDDITDCTQAAAERLVLYRVTELFVDYRELVQTLVKSAQQVRGLVGLLRDMRQRKAIVEHCIEINRLENTGDHLYREALGELFRRGDLMELMRWKEIFEHTERALDVAEDLADVVEGLVVKHA